MPISSGPRQVTVNDIIHADERVVALKKKYQEAQNKKNQKVLDISYVESDIIKTMGAFEYLNNFNEVDEARADLLPEFRRLITRKHILIEEIRDEERAMEEYTQTFNKLADEIVKDLQRQFGQSGSAPESGESAPEVSAPECDCHNPDCNCQH